MNRFTMDTRRSAIEAAEGWRKWIDRIPAIPMPAGWRVQMLPPYAGALARFAVVNLAGQHKSVYLDVWERLGFWGGGPYWEVYPVDNDVARCDMNDVAELIRLIEAPRGDEGEDMVERNTGEPAGPLLLTHDDALPALPIGEAEVLWHEPDPVMPERPGKIIDASHAFMDAAPLGTRLYSAEQMMQYARDALRFSTAQGGQFDGQPAQADQGLPRAFAGRDRRDERDQDDGIADRGAGGEAAGTGRARPAVGEHRGDGLAERADGPDARRGATDFLLTEAELRAMRSEVRASPEAEHTVWWLLLCRAVEACVIDRAARAVPEGMVLVPREPDQRYWDAVWKAAQADGYALGSASVVQVKRLLDVLHSALIAAAPAPEDTK